MDINKAILDIIIQKAEECWKDDPYYKMGKLESEVKINKIISESRIEELELENKILYKIIEIFIEEKNKISAMTRIWDGCSKISSEYPNIDSIKKIIDLILEEIVPEEDITDNSSD